MKRAFVQSVPQTLPISVAATKAVSKPSASLVQEPQQVLISQTCVEIVYSSCPELSMLPNGLLQTLEGLKTAEQLTSEKLLRGPRGMLDGPAFGPELNLSTNTCPKPSTPDSPPRVSRHFCPDLQRELRSRSTHLLDCS